MLRSQTILYQFCSNFGFYISGPILTKYILTPHRISANSTTSNIKISTNLNYFKCFYLCQFSTDLGQNLDSTSYDQSQQSIWYHTKSQQTKLIPQLQISELQQISIRVKLRILHLMTNPNKVYDTTPNLNQSKSQLISVNLQPILVNIWILHLMTIPNKVYDTTPNLKHLKSQLISTT